MQDNNIRLLCKEDSNKRRIEFQNKIHAIKIGDNVKKEFFEEGKSSEHMWVCVISLLKNGIYGILNNIPIGLNNIKFGDKVFVGLKEIEAITNAGR